jgi:hypothetical protein
MKRLLQTLTVALVATLASSSLEAQQIFKTTKTSVISYLEYVPKDYHSNSNKYPIVFFFHGIGERGPNTTDLATLESAVWSVTKNGPPKHVKNGHQFPFILISPQLKENYGTWPAWYMLEVINHVKTYLRIDERRIHVTGLSLGGGGAWVAAQEFPKLFASVSPICGGYNSPSKACGIAAENLPVWAFHGDADPVVSYTKTVNMVNAINACTPKPSPLAKVTIYPGVNHNSWDRAYTLDNTYHTPNLYEWLMPLTNIINAGNRIPVANAGSDKISTSKSLTLSGSATDADGSITAYKWRKLSGPSCTLSNASTASLSLSGLTPGVYMFKFTVTDNSGDTDSDYIKLIINKPPTANAGADVTITLPKSDVTLNGSGTDSDGTIVSYKWVFISGPKVPVLTGATSKSVNVSSMTIAGDYVMQLEVKDNYGAVGKDRVTITVLEETTSATTDTQLANELPTVNAGKDVTLFLPTSSTTLTGVASDPDGTISSYSWTQVSGPIKASLSGATSPKVTVSGMTVEGFYVFKLTVKDNSGGIASDKVGVTVKSSTTSSTDDPWSTRLVANIRPDESPDLAQGSSPYWKDKQVEVFTETGARIYAGGWTENTYGELFTNQGLYLYVVTSQGRRVLSGKLMILPQ